MSSSLDSLTKNLVSGGKKLFGFEDYSELQYDLLTRKGVYPYIVEIHYHKENKTNGGKQIEFSAESNQFKNKSNVGINEMFSNC